MVERQGGHPDGNEPLLAKVQAELRMPRDLEEELAVPSRVEQLTLRRPAKWKPIKDERAGVEGQVLGSFFPLLADEPNGFELLEAALRDPYRGSSRHPQAEGAVSELGGDANTTSPFTFERRGRWLLVRIVKCSESGVREGVVTFLKNFKSEHEWLKQLSRAAFEVTSTLGAETAFTVPAGPRPIGLRYC